MDFTNRLGVRTLLQADGECRLELVMGEEHMSWAERAHGGVLFTLLDTALGRAVLSTLPEDRGCATLECKINFFRPVTGGRLHTQAKMLTRTRRTAYAEGSIHDDEERLVARASATFFITDTRVQAERERV